MARRELLFVSAAAKCPRPRTYKNAPTLYCNALAEPFYWESTVGLTNTQRVQVASWDGSQGDIEQSREL